MEDAIHDQLPVSEQRINMGLVQRVKAACYAHLDSPRTTYRHLVHGFAANSRSVLDIGCGYTAPDLQAISRPGLRCVGLDLVPLRESAESQIELIQADCCRMPFRDGEFDLVISRSVFEHLQNPTRAFSEISRVLSPGGRCTFLTPNRWDYVSLAATVIPNRWHPRLVRCLTGRNEDDTFPTFYRANSTSCLRNLAAKSCLAIERLQLVRQHPHYLQSNIVSYSVGVAYEMSLQRAIQQLRPWILGVLLKP